MRGDSDGVLDRQVQVVSYYRLHQALCRELGREAPDFPDLPDEERYAWLASFEAACPAVEAAADNPRTFAELGKVAWDAYHGGLPYEGARPAWDVQDARTQLVWKCVIRHLVNLLVFDTGEDGGVEGHEERMRSFFAVKAQELKEAEAAK
jgi:hypothetical protein